MAIIRFTATRSLMDGAALGDVVEIDTAFRAATPSQRRQGVFNQSLGGRREGILYRVEKIWDLTTGYHFEEDVALWDMFFGSTLNAEPFEIIDLGTKATPKRVLRVELLSTSVQQTRIATKLMRVTFQVRELNP